MDPWEKKRGTAGGKNLSKLKSEKGHLLGGTIRKYQLTKKGSRKKRYSVKIKGGKKSGHTIPNPLIRKTLGWGLRGGR